MANDPDMAKEEQILPYTHGLAGVNLPVNDITTQALWISIAAFALLVLTIRLFQLTSTHIRYLTTLGLSNSKLKYWSLESPTISAIKKHFLYAPLLHKRHNNELRLSSAISLCTIPSRVETLLLLAYLFSNVAYCCLLDYHRHPYASLIAEIRGRTGHLAVINMVVLFVFATRNNPLIPLLGISFNTFNLFHRWIGRMVVLEAGAHTLMWWINKHAALGNSGVIHALLTDGFCQFGLLGTIAMTLILIQTPSPLRHAFYEFFLHLHQFLAAAALVGVGVHVHKQALPQKPMMYFIIAVWATERLTRILRLAYHNISFSRSSTGSRITKAHIETLEGGACRVTFTFPSNRKLWTEQPGCHIYAYFPALSWWMNHPFSVAWVRNESSSPPPSTSSISSTSNSSTFSPSTSSLDFLQIPKRPSLSHASSSTTIAADMQIHSPDIEALSPQQVSPISILPKLNADLDIETLPPTPLFPPNTTTTSFSSSSAVATQVSCIMASRTGMTSQLYTLASKAGGNVTLTAAVEGPYGAAESLRSYGTVLLFAGGAGITNQLSHVRDLVTAHRAGLAATRKVVLVWSVREVCQLEWIRPFLEELLQDGGVEKEWLKVVLCVSGLKARGFKALEIETALEGMLGRYIEINPGRCDVKATVKAEHEERIGAMTVGVCGPGALGDGVREAVRGVIGGQRGRKEGKVEFWEEAFTW